MVHPAMTYTVDVSTLDALRERILAHADDQYDGENVTHMVHALGTAWLARKARARPALIAAAFLHDCGHALAGLPGTPSAQGIDDAHELLASRLLSAWLGPAVTEPIRLHVAAKQYLCGYARYHQRLSEDSRRSLALQGGVFDALARARFRAEPYFADALRLRIWDDAAKCPHMPTLHFADAWGYVTLAAGQRTP